MKAFLLLIQPVSVLVVLIAIWVVLKLLIEMAQKVQDVLAPVFAWLARFIAAVFWAAIIAPVTGVSIGVAAGALDHDGAMIDVTAGAVTFIFAVMILMRRSARPIFARPIFARATSAKATVGGYDSSARWSSPGGSAPDPTSSPRPPPPPPEPLPTDPLPRAWVISVRMADRYRERIALARTRCAALLACADAAPDDLTLFDWANVIRRRVPELVAACEAARAGAPSPAADIMADELVAALDAIGREAEARRLAAQAEARARFDTMRAYVAGRTGGDGTTALDDRS